MSLTIGSVFLKQKSCVWQVPIKVRNFSIPERSYSRDQSPKIWQNGVET